jgi:hypothetical protein
METIVNKNRYLLCAIHAAVLLYAAEFCYSNEIEQRFDQLYQEWKIARAKEGHRSDYPGYTKLVEIEELGVQTIPLFFMKLNENPNDNGLLGSFRLVWTRITRKVFDRELYLSINTPNRKDNKGVIKLYEDWWYHGRKDAPKEFQEAYANWKKFKDEGKTEENELALKKIRCMGTIVLPFVLDKLKQGDVEFIPVISFWSGDVLKDAGVEECIAWCEKNKEKWYIEIPADDSAESETKSK